MASRKPKMARELIRENTILHQNNKIEHLLEEVDVLKSKVCLYSHTASEYEEENKDLRVHCKEVEENVKASRKRARN